MIWAAICLALVAGAVSLYTLVYRPKVVLRAELLAQRDEFRQTNSALMGEISDYKLKQLMFNSDPDFVVITAHKDNKILTNEIVFIFPRPKR